MNFENKQHLGGKLVGIGKIRTDGTMEHRFLDKPIKNKIVSTGLDHMLRYAGSDTSYYSGSSRRYNFLVEYFGATSHYCPLHFSSFGTSLESTAFFDEGLKTEVGSKVSTKVAGAGLCGTKINSFGNYSFRISHKHSAVSETTTVNEIAWFGRYGSSSYVYPMFSRVVLDTPVVLASGEQLITTYQLDWQYDGTTAENISFFGLTDVDGQPLKAQKKFVMYQNVSSSEWSDQLAGGFIDTSGGGTSSGYGEESGFAHPALCPYDKTNAYSGALYYSVVDKVIPTDGNYFTTNSYSSSAEKNYHVPITSSSQLSDTTYNIGVPAAYNGVGRTTKYRDCVYMMGAYSPNIFSSDGYKDITNLLCRGYAYRFGYYDDGGNWVQQAFRKYANQALTLTFRTRFTTEDTTSEE